MGDWSIPRSIGGATSPLGYYTDSAASTAAAVPRINAEVYSTHRGKRVLTSACNDVVVYVDAGHLVVQPKTTIEPFMKIPAGSIVGVRRGNGGNSGGSSAGGGGVHHTLAVGMATLSPPPPAPPATAIEIDTDYGTSLTLKPVQAGPGTMQALQGVMDDVARAVMKPLTHPPFTPPLMWAGGGGSVFRQQQPHPGDAPAMTPGVGSGADDFHAQRPNGRGGYVPAYDHPQPQQQQQQQQQYHHPASQPRTLPSPQGYAAQTPPSAATGGGGGGYTGRDVSVSIPVSSLPIAAQPQAGAPGVAVPGGGYTGGDVGGEYGVIRGTPYAAGGGMHPPHTASGTAGGRYAQNEQRKSRYVVPVEADGPPGHSAGQSQIPHGLGSAQPSPVREARHGPGVLRQQQQHQPPPLAKPPSSAAHSTGTTAMAPAPVGGLRTLSPPERSLRAAVAAPAPARGPRTPVSPTAATATPVSTPTTTTTYRSAQGVGGPRGRRGRSASPFYESAAATERSERGVGSGSGGESVPQSPMLDAAGLCSPPPTPQARDARYHDGGGAGGGSGHLHDPAPPLIYEGGADPSVVLPAKRAPSPPASYRSTSPRAPTQMASTKSPVQHASSATSRRTVKSPAPAGPNVVAANSQAQTHGHRQAGAKGVIQRPQSQAAPPQPPATPLSIKRAASASVSASASPSVLGRGTAFSVGSPSPVRGGSGPVASPPAHPPPVGVKSSAAATRAPPQQPHRSVKAPTKPLGPPSASALAPTPAVPHLSAAVKGSIPSPPKVTQARPQPHSSHAPPAPAVTAEPPRVVPPSSGGGGGGASSPPLKPALKSAVGAGGGQAPSSPTAYPPGTPYHYEQQGNAPGTLGVRPQRSVVTIAEHVSEVGAGTPATDEEGSEGTALSALSPPSPMRLPAEGESGEGVPLLMREEEGVPPHGSLLSGHDQAITREASTKRICRWCHLLATPEHELRRCAFRQVLCPYCRAGMPAKEYPTHADACPENPVAHAPASHLEEL